MKKLLLLVLAVLSLALLVGCGGGGGGSDTPSKTTFSISGYVLDADGHACSGYTVALFSIDKIVAEKTTASNGYYAFTDLKAGEYKVVAYNTDYEMLSIEEQYTTYTGKVDVEKDLEVVPAAISKGLVKADYVYNSEDGYTSTWTPYEGVGETTDGRTISYAFSTDTTTKDVELYNFYVKFDDGSISKIQGTISGGQLDINTEVPVCNSALSGFSKGDCTVTKGDTYILCLEGAGCFVVSEMNVTSSNPMINDQKYYVSPELGWIVKYNDGTGADFTLVDID